MKRTKLQKRYIRDVALWFGDDHCYIIVNRTKPHVYSGITDSSMNRLWRLIDKQCKWSAPNIDFSIYVGN